MNNEQQNHVERGGTDPRIVRTQDNAIGIDDIGLPSDMLPEGVARPDEIKPDPEKIKADAGRA